MSLPLSETMEKAPLPRLSKRSVLDLAPLELDCMNTLWPMGEGTVREIRDRLAERRARAYTTIMTIMDRLARKGVVERRKTGRAYTYRPRLSAEEAQAQALGQVIEGFFGGSKEALLAHLGNGAGARRAVSAATSLSASGAAAPVAATVETGETFARERLDSTPI
jgi:BlaI family transcriptional regulator, penicillinase repressor